MANPLDQIDPFLGIDEFGNCLCGPYLPFSLVRLGPDTLPPHKTNGYTSGEPILHFSHTHLSGTGGTGRYGNIGVMPFLGRPRLQIDASEISHETAQVGFYGVTLEPSDIRVELTSTPRTGIHRYTFPAGKPANILIDAGATLQNGYDHPKEKSPASVGGYIERVSACEISGRADFVGGWGHLHPYSIYFFARADRPWDKLILGNGEGILNRDAACGANARAVMHYAEGNTVNLQVGISYTSVANARASVDREAAGRTFEEICEASRATWQKFLSRLQVEGGSEEERKIFHTMHYRLLCMPSDLGVDDEFHLWKSGVRQFTDVLCLWDSVRNANSFLALIEPEFSRDLMNAFLDIYDHTGWLPDAWVNGHSAWIQGGSSADVILSEYAQKGIAGIDYKKALRATRKNAEVPPPDPYSSGRYHPEYQTLGFTTTRVALGCVSRHLEYAYQDWCIGKLAEVLGDQETAGKFINDSQKLWNLWRDDKKGFAPKNPDGSWVEPFAPEYYKDEFWYDPYFYEGNSIRWSFNTQHDFAGLVKRHGGAEAFVEYLNAYFSEDQKDKRFNYRQNETGLHIAYLYLYAGRPDLTMLATRKLLKKYYNPTRKGLHDNEDMGSQSTFYICSSLGFYPVMGQDLYWLTAPVFTRGEVSVNTKGDKLIIEAPAASEQNTFVQSATLNGAPLDRAWIRHREISNGAVIHFVMGDQPTAWGKEALPPSPLSAT